MHFWLLKIHSIGRFGVVNLAEPYYSWLLGALLTVRSCDWLGQGLLLL